MNNTERIVSVMCSLLKVVFKGGFLQYSISASVVQFKVQMSKLNGLGKTHREPFGSRTIKAVQENSYKFNRN